MTGPAKLPHLFFHAPCFDGVVSAALILRHLVEPHMLDAVKLEPVNYDEKDKWLDRRLPRDSAVVDFLYHPDAHFWVDHHRTTFLTSAAESDYRSRLSRGDQWQWYDSSADSAARVIWTRLHDAAPVDAARSTEIVRWADIVDAARYENVTQAVCAQSPALRVARSLARDRDRLHSTWLVRELSRRSLDDVAADARVRDRADGMDREVRDGLARLKAATRLTDDGVAVFNVDARDVVVNRYAPFLHYPSARYCAGILRWDDLAKVTAMRNPWMDFPSAPLGVMFAQVGGGGHERIGSVMLRGDRRVEAGAILHALLASIREWEDAPRLEPA